MTLHESERLQSRFTPPVGCVAGQDMKVVVDLKSARHRVLDLVGHHSELASAVELFVGVPALARDCLVQTTDLMLCQA